MANSTKIVTNLKIIVHIYCIFKVFIVKYYLGKKKIII